METIKDLIIRRAKGKVSAALHIKMVLFMKAIGKAGVKADIWIDNLAVVRRATGLWTTGAKIPKYMPALDFSDAALCTLAYPPLYLRVHFLRFKRWTLF